MGSLIRLYEWILPVYTSLAGHIQVSLYPKPPCQGGGVFTGTAAIPVKKLLLWKKFTFSRFEVISVG